MSEPKFGDRVSCLQKLRRGYDFDRPHDWDGPYYKTWLRVAMKPRVGILIGYRTLMTVKVYPRQPHSRQVKFDVVGRHRAALVVFSGGENPVYVPVDAMAAA